MFRDNKIKSRFIFEILGRPAEHIKLSLEGFISKLGEQKEIRIINTKVHEPKPVENENAKNLFTTFAEVELETDNLNAVFGIVLNMLPAHVEIIEPEELRLNNFDLSFILSDLSVKLHKYDEIAKGVLLERNGLMNRIKDMQMRINELEGKKTEENVIISENIENKKKDIKNKKKKR